MKIRCLLTTLLLLTSTACTSGALFSSGQTSGIWKDANGKAFPIQHNPHPKEAYDFTVTLIDAPKELQATQAAAFYLSDCRLPVDKLAGANTQMSYTLPITFNKLKDNVYHATVYWDALLEDFPNGAKCQWELFSSDMYFEPTPNIANIRYLASIDLQKENQISPNAWTVDQYITRYRFNEAGMYRKNKDGSLFTRPLMMNKDFFGEKQRAEFAIIRMEVKKK